MTNSLPPNDRPPRLQDDEPIALLIAFLAFSAIGFWAFQDEQNGRLGSQRFWQAPVPTVATPTDPFSLFNTASPQITRPDSHLPSLSDQPTPEWTVPPQAPMQSFVPAAPASDRSPSHPAIGGGTLPSPMAEFFRDVPSTHWAYAYIKTLTDRKLTEGFPDNTYRPDEPVTRSDYAAMIDRAFPSANQVVAQDFRDVAIHDPRSQAVKAAVESNFMSGYPDRTFKPDQTMSRTEAISAMVKGLGLPTPTNPDQVLEPYGDLASIPNWAKPKMAAAIASNLLVDHLQQGRLAPNKPITRSEVAALLVKGLETQH